MITFDWRRCPAPSLLPDSSRPADTGLPRGDYENGPMIDQGGVVGYGPLSSDLGPRFGTGTDNGDSDDGNGNGIFGIDFGGNCWLWAGLAAVSAMLLKGR